MVPQCWLVSLAKKELCRMHLSNEFEYFWFDASVVSFHPCRRIVFAFGHQKHQCSRSTGGLCALHKALQGAPVASEQIRNQTLCGSVMLRGCTRSKSAKGPVQLQVGDVIRDNTGDMLSDRNWRNKAKYKVIRCLLAKIACQIGRMRRTLFFFQCM